MPDLKSENPDRANGQGFQNHNPSPQKKGLDMNNMSQTPENFKNVVSLDAGRKLWDGYGRGVETSYNAVPSRQHGFFMPAFWREGEEYNTGFPGITPPVVVRFLTSRRQMAVESRLSGVRNANNEA